MTATDLINDEIRGQYESDYRYLHAHPELSMQEHNTAIWLEARMEDLGFEHFRCGGTGVVGILRNGEGPVIAYRADTDGLPIQEDSDLPFASTARGTLPDGTEVPVMHGCGHDTHMAVGLAMCRVLAENRDLWSGTLVMLLQPGEETGAGAKAMVEDGVWDKAPNPEAVFGQHVMPGETGTISVASGTAAAMSDVWRITLRGRQTHGSQPQDGLDPIVLGSHLVTRLQSIVSREVDPRDMAVVTVGTFHAGLKANIIPDTAVIELNVRTFEPAVRDKVLGGIRRMVAAEVAASGAPEATIEELETFPKLYNDPDTTVDVVEVLRAELGDDKVIMIPALTGSEDFGLFAEALGVPSVYWFYGGHPRELLDAGEPIPKNHSPQFTPVAQPTLDTAVRAAVAVMLSRLGK